MDEWINVLTMREPFLTLTAMSHQPANLVVLASKCFANQAHYIFTQKSTHLCAEQKLSILILSLN